MKMLKKILYSTPALFLYICIVVYAAQVAIVDTDTLNEAWTKETNNNSDLQTNIDGKEGTLTNSAGLAAAISDETGTGVVVYSNTPTLVTPEIGAATGTTLVLSGALTADGLNSGPGTTPGVRGYDSDAAGTGEALFMGTLRWNWIDGAEGSENSDTWLSAMQGGSELIILLFDESDDQVEFNVNTAFQAGDIDTAEIATDAVDYTITSGSSKALTPVSGSTTGFAAGFTGANLYGGTYVVTSDDGDLPIPAMLINMHFTIITSGAIEVVADCNAADGYLLDGVTGAEGANITNLSTSGDIAVYQYYTDDDWLVTTNGWTAE